MTSEEHQDLKWLIQQKQWKTFKGIIQEEVDKLVGRFLTDEQSDLKMLQIQAIATKRLIDFVENLVMDNELEKEKKR